MIDKINNYFKYLKDTLDSINKDDIINIINILNKARDLKKQIFIMGNGGSAATASHFACDINKGTKNNGKNYFKVICLNDNIPTMLAYANDTYYDEIFVEQLKNFLNKGDIVIGISGSGNSKNILNAISYANCNNAVTLGITGFNGGRLKEIADYSINTNVNDMQISEDIHMILTHLLMKILKGCSNDDIL